MRKYGFLILAAALIGSVAGCANFDEDYFADDMTSDSAIASTALSRLNNDMMTARSGLGVTVENGLATLYGTVPDEATRMRAHQILENTPGVFRVQDNTRKR